MKIYKGAEWQYGEREVEEVGTGKRYTLTQKTEVLNEDFYLVYRTIAVPHQSDDLDYLYIYEIYYMIASNGSCLVSRTVDEATMYELFVENALDVMRGKIDFESWFNEKESKA